MLILQGMQQTLSSNEYEILVDASGDNIVMEQSQFLTEDGDTLTDQDGTQVK